MKYYNIKQHKHGQEEKIAKKQNRKEADVKLKIKGGVLVGIF